MALTRTTYQDESYLYGFLGTVGDLQKEGELQDVVLEVEGRRFPCHRLVLSAASPYFRAMFTSDMAESRQKTVVLQGLDGDTFGEILSYIYSGTLHVSLDRVQHLYQAADLLQLDYVRDTCSSYMARNVEHSTCVDLYKFADVFSVSSVLKRCLRYICRHFVKVSSSEEFCSLSVDQLTEVISHDELDVEEETAVWEAVVRWVQHSTEDRLHYLPSILPHIRFNLLTSDNTAAILEHPLVREDPGSIQVIRNVVKEASVLKKRFRMDTMEMACLLDMETGDIFCMNPRQGKYTKISLPPHLKHKLLAGMTVTSDNDLYVLIHEPTDHQLYTFEYNQVCKEWEQTCTSVSRFCDVGWGGGDFASKEFFVEVDKCLYLIMVKDTLLGMVVWTRRYNWYTEEWQECEKLHFEEGADEIFCVGVTSGSHLYFLMNSEVHRYDPVHDQWDRMTPPRTLPHLSTAVAMGTEIFCTDYKSTKIMVYDTVSDSWEALQACVNPFRNRIDSRHLFVLENQLHVLLEPDNSMAEEGEEEDCLVLVYDRSEDAWRDLKATLPPVECYEVCGPMCTMAQACNVPTMP
ncbi:Broad-Complex, Tramtrack and Bric a brac [Branchiostoma belcheri]|nr:Broad-Complex, Tramtrack and Bric a brac [Branchiostoma belcheri]